MTIKDLKITPQEICEAINQLLDENKELKEEIEEYKKIEKFDSKLIMDYESKWQEFKQWLEEQSMQPKVDDFFTVIRLSDIKAKIEELEDSNE